MVELKHVLFAVLTTTLLAANTVCACETAAAGDPPAPVEMQASDAHAHHVHGGHGDMQSGCAHADCDGCDVTIVQPEREPSLKSPQSGVIASAPPLADVRRPIGQLVRYHTLAPPHTARDNPVSRKDLLLH